MPAAHELVMGQLDRMVPIALTSRPDENDFPSPRQITARTSGRGRNSVEHVEEPDVHLVVERVVLVGVVVGDGGDRPVDLQVHLIGHSNPPASWSVTRDLPSGGSLVTCQQLRRELLDGAGAAQRHRSADVGVEQAEHVVDAALAPGAQAVEVGPADRAGGRRPGRRP